MAVSTFDLTWAIVQSRYLPHVTLHDGSKPTSTQAGNVLTEVAAEVNGALSVAGFTASDIDSSGEPIAYNYVRKAIALGVAGYVLQAMSSGSSPDAARYLDEYREMVATIHKTPEVLSDLYGTTSQKSQPRSHITDHSMTDSGTRSTDVTPPIRMSGGDSEW